MKSSKKDLIFIRRICSDGKSLENVERKNIKNEDYELTRLSITEDTYIASGLYTYIVKKKSSQQIGFDY